VFFARQEAPDPARSALRSLRPSLNTPVVVVDDLPAGPATAVIASLGGPEGSRVALAIRSERSGQVVFFGPDHELLEWQGPDHALDAALSFAESMGFLFEDDRLAPAPTEARRLWEALLEAASRGRRLHVGNRSAPTADPRAESPESQEELWLEEVATPEPPVARTLPLTKFRSAGRLQAGPREGNAGAALPPPLARFRVGPERRSS